MIGHFCLRMALWLLLTANFGWVNLLIGSLIALMLPYNSQRLERLPDLLQGLGKIVLAIPQAYLEAIQLILRPHNREEIHAEPVQPRLVRQSGLPSPGLIFLDIFLITFTPKTTVLRYYQQEGQGWYDVHYVVPGRALPNQPASQRRPGK